MRQLWDRARALLPGGKPQQRPGHTPMQSPRGRWCGGCRCSIGLLDGCVRLSVLLLLVCSIVFVAMTFDVSNLEGLLLWVKENKLQGSALFLMMYTLAIVLMVPAMVMAMCAGAIFGLLAGTLLVWTGSTVGQVLAFMVGRYLLRDFVLRFLTEQYPKWGAIDRALEREGWKLVTLLRLSPIAPWNVLNYALAVTAVPVGPYALASSLAVIPYLVMFTYLGSLARTLSDIFGGLAGPDTGTTIALGAVSGVLLVAIVWWTTQLAKKAIREALVEEEDNALAESATSEMDVLHLLRGGSTAAADSAAGDLLDGVTVEMQRLDPGLSPRTQGVQPLPGWSPRAGGVAATVQLVGGGTPTAAADLRGRRDQEVHLIPLVPKKVVTPRGGESRSSDVHLGGADTLQHVARSGVRAAA